MRAMVMTPFAPGWVAFLLLMTAVGVVAHLLLRRRPRRVQRRALLALALLAWACSTWFTFDRAANPANHFPITQNLPFHFCTLVTFLLIPAVWLQKGRLLGPLRALLFYPGAAAGFLALCSPAVEYTGRPYWSMNTLFYVVHALNVVVPVLMASLRLYRPTVRDAFLSLVWFFALAMAVLPLTLALRAWVDAGSNYFYFFDPEGAGILVVLWNLIHVPVAYEAPLLVIIAPVLLAQYGIYRAVSALARRVSGPTAGDGGQVPQNAPELAAA